ncbi:MAG: hypothetical protein JWN52_5222 [Actinomycetia bacterium]|nr:hypothetical protein [Actinomycetes bacterium]
MSVSIAASRLTSDRVVVVDWPWEGLPTLRAFQDAQGRAALTWLRTRTGWV